MNFRTAMLALLLASTSAPAVTLPTPIAAEVFVRGETKATMLRGKLTSFDDRQFTLHVGQSAGQAEDKTLNWSDITPASAYALRSKTIDRQKPSGWLDLGKFAWSIGLKDQAKAAFKAAVRLDPASESEVDTTLATPAGALLEAAPPKELIKSGPAPQKNPSASAGPSDAPDKATAFKPASAEENAAALKLYREQAAGVAETLGVEFQSFETDHFLIFTNWDQREADFLKQNLENAYRVVAKQFDMTPKDNIFVGKLPVYMLDTYKQFDRFADKVDKWQTNSRMAGYYFGNTMGIGHMAMWKPNESLTGTNNINDARRLWAYVLVHEFTHAFLARYRSNEFIPRWMNEGIAEVIATGEFPYPDHDRIAHMMAIENKDVTFLFDSKNIPTGEYYPVMQSMVQLLINQNRGNFLKLIDAIKDGEDPETALKRLYNTDYETLAHVWREWARRH